MIAERVLGARHAQPRWFWPVFLASGGGAAMLFALIGYTLITGIGVWGNDIPVAWAFAIINFVFWIGIGHAGTFISAILLLCGQKWRTSLGRIAETMTLFALVNAAMFPLIHLGRPWFAQFLVPYPSSTRLWPQFKSALPWDAAAVATYGLVSLLFWYVGLIPDLAAARDSAKSRWAARAYGVLSLGWRGTARQWSQHKSAEKLLAGLATPLVVSVHSIVSLDFAITLLPGWHSAIFPPFFVAGAILSGFAMVLLLAMVLRRAYGFEDLITDWHLDNCAKMVLVTGTLVLYAYAIEAYVAWWTGEPYERYVLLVNRPGSWAFWLTVFCNGLAPQVFWSKRARRSIPVLVVVSLLVLLGMWLERFVLIVSSQSTDFLPSSWHSYLPTPIDGGILFGTFCLFTFLYLAFVRTLPMIPIAEVNEEQHGA